MIIDLENMDSIEIDSKDIERVFFGRIYKTGYFADGKYNEYDAVNNVLIVLETSANKPMEYDLFGRNEDKLSVFDYLMQVDVVSLRFGEKTYSVEWRDDGVRDYMNKLQHTYLDSKGRLVIVIGGSAFQKEMRNSWIN